jgi:hypothetical protein
MTGFEQLAAALRQEGGLLAQTLGEAPGGDALVDEAAAGTRAAVAPDVYALVLAAVREGYLLHYDEPRVVHTADPDLALLGGDRLYALGLARLAELGDLAAVARLADLISACAQAHAEDDPAAAEAAWRASATAIGHGSAPAA